jgi:hypothetical protein
LAFLQDLGYFHPLQIILNTTTIVKSLRKTLLTAGLLISATASQAQLLNLPAEIHGNFQFDAQYYIKDSLIGALDVPEKVLSNGFGNLNFTKGKIQCRNPL